jgi:hypothetical protein
MKPEYPENTQLSWHVRVVLKMNCWLEKGKTSIILNWNVCKIQTKILIRVNRMEPSNHYSKYLFKRIKLTSTRGRRGRDRMVVGFTTTYAISAYNH